MEEFLLVAYKSFRIRRVDAGASPDANPFGSYVRGTETDAPTGLTRVDSDSSLRADGFIAPVGALDTLASFSAIATTHTSVQLFWSNFLITNPALNVATETNIQGIVLVYSSTGAPETVADGILIKRQIFNDTTFSFNHTNLPSGQWAYYSLFLHWNQNGTGNTGVNWYERVATLQELVPFTHQTTDSLWSRIPANHRRQDTYGRDTDPEGLDRGYLYRFLNIFGFEFDKTRTLIDSVVRQYDPEITEAESIEQLSKMFGLEVTPQDLGTSRVRQLLKDLTYYRKRKGTLDAIKQSLIAISGSDVDIVESTSSPRYKFNVHAGKANLIADSLFVIESGTKKWDLSSQTASVSYTKNGKYITVSNTGSASAQFSLLSTVSVPIKADTEYWSSIKITTASAGFIWGAQYASASTSWSDWATTSQTSQVVANNLSPTGRKVILNPNISTTASYFPVLILGLGAGQSTVVSEWMLEPNTYGDFFNGDSDFGGFVYQNNLADHQWAGSQYASHSTYSPNRTKTQETINRLLPNLFPVTMLLDTSIDTELNYDWIPGET